MTDQPPTQAEQTRALLEATAKDKEGGPENSDAAALHLDVSALRPQRRDGRSRADPRPLPGVQHADPPETDDHRAALAAVSEKARREQALLESEAGPEAGVPAVMPEDQPHLGEATDAVSSALPPPPESGPLDRGWLMVCIGEALDTMRRQDGIEDIEDLMEDDNVQQLAHLASTMYEGDRWSLLCGCKAGAHGPTIAAIQEARPGAQGDGMIDVWQVATLAVVTWIAWHVWRGSRPRGRGGGEVRCPHGSKLKLTHPPDGWIVEVSSIRCPHGDRISGS